jgi:hypothetical protein
MVLQFVPIRPQLRISEISPNKVRLGGQRIKPPHIAPGGADEAVLVAISAWADSCFLRMRRPMSFVNQPGNRFILSMGQLRRKLTRPVAKLFSSTATSQSERARRNA